MLAFNTRTRTYFKLTDQITGEVIKIHTQSIEGLHLVSIAVECGQRFKIDRDAWAHDEVYIEYLVKQYGVGWREVAQKQIEKSRINKKLIEGENKNDSGQTHTRIGTRKIIHTGARD